MFTNLGVNVNFNCSGHFIIYRFSSISCSLVIIRDRCSYIIRQRTAVFNIVLPDVLMANIILWSKVLHLVCPVGHTDRQASNLFGFPNKAQTYAQNISSFTVYLFTRRFVNLTLNNVILLFRDKQVCCQFVWNQFITDS